MKANTKGLAPVKARRQPTPNERIKAAHGKLSPGTYDGDELRAMVKKACNLQGGRSSIYSLAVMMRRNSPEWMELGNDKWTKLGPNPDALPEPERPEPMPIVEAPAEAAEPYPLLPMREQNILRDKLADLATKYQDTFQAHRGEMLSIAHMAPSLPYLEEAVPHGYRMEISIAYDHVTVRLGLVGP